jgi:RNA polymerase sigma-70 factor (TIGR02943 family)
MGDRKDKVSVSVPSTLLEVALPTDSAVVPAQITTYCPDTNEISEAACLERDETIAKWVDEYGDRLYSFAMVRLRDPDTCEDLVQDTFISAYKAWQTFEGRSSGYTWLVKILKNKIVDHVRKVKRHNEVPYDEGEDSSLFNGWDLWATPFKDWGAAPEAHLSKREFYVQFQKCLEQLPDKYREAFILRTIDDLDAEEVCSVLNISQNNLWVVLHRARLRLRSCLEKNWFGATVNSNPTNEEED